MWKINSPNIVLGPTFTQMVVSFKATYTYFKQDRTERNKKKKKKKKKKKHVQDVDICPFLF